MSTLDCPANAETSAAVQSGVRGLYFTSQGRALFAWLHTPVNGTTHDHAVVLCPSIGHEQVHAHRGLRHLAQSLAGRGIATLRFDWFATGDSSGGDEDLDLSQQWLANVRDAVAFMRRECGFRQVSVIGFRAGGLLAVEGLADESMGGKPIENLVLWAPVASGRGLTRELILLGASDATNRAADGLEAGGFRYGAKTVAGLAGLNIVKRNPPCRHALVVSRDDGPADRRLLDWLRGHGVEAEGRSLSGVTEMLAEPHDTQVPHAAIAAITAWLAERVVPPAANGLQRRAGNSGYVARDLREHLWQAGQAHGLAGVVAEPLATNRGLPLIVLLNSGAAYRVGVSRLNVAIARRVAELGFRSLRFDLRGLGDSVIDCPQRENDAYPATGFDDMQQVLRLAREEFGHERFVFVGLCSGAYFAFQAAAQFRDAALVESILINPLTYFWREGMTINDAELRERLESHWRFSRRLDRRRLWKFLSGQSRVGYLQAAREIIARLAPRGLRDCGAGVPPAPSDCVAIGHPGADDLPGDLTRIARAGRALTLFVAQTDPGLAILNSQAQPQVKQLMRKGILRATRIADADHTFSRSGPRNELLNRLAAHLAQRYL